jgi:hypothetical protein
MPPDTFVYAEARDVGAMVRQQLACLRDNPIYEELIPELEGSMGKIDDLVAWADDAAIGLRYDGTSVTGGIVVNVNDPIKAGEAMGQLRAALEALGKQSGKVTVTEESYHDAHLVSFDFNLRGTNALPAPLPHTSISYALSNDLLILGVDASFAKAVLDTDAAASLATNTSYSRALDFVAGRSNAGAFFVDIPQAVKVLDKLYASNEYAGQQFADVRKYIDPFDEGIGVVLSDGNVQTVRFMLNTRDVH